MVELSYLCIGELDRQYMDSDFTFGMDAIGDSLTENANNLLSLWDNRGTRDFVKFGPMCARLVFEQSLAVLLGRMDPIRFVSLIRGAESADFVLGQRNASSFNWTRDVLPDVRPLASGWWSQETLAKQIHRTLLHGHLADYLFESAHVTLITDLTDWTANLSALPSWITDLLKFEKGDGVLGLLRKDAAESYSSLSKGIHFEFLKGNSTALTREEVTIAISDAITVVTTVALYSHFTDISLQKLSRTDALTFFMQLVAKFDYAEE